MPVFAPPAAEETVGYLIDRTFDLLLGAGREERNQLAVDIDNQQQTFTVNYDLGNLRRGTYLCIDQEVMYVWSSTAGSGSTSSVTVFRGDKGTDPAAHFAGAIIQVNPYFTRYQVKEAIRDEIRSWQPQVFQVKSIDIQGVNYVRGYDFGITDMVLGVLSCKQSPDLEIAMASDEMWTDVRYRFDSAAEPSVFPSGRSLTLVSPMGMYDTPRTLRVTYATPIDVDTTFGENDYLGPMGLSSMEVDIPPMGAAWRLSASREVRRMLTEAQGQVADLTNVPAGYQIKAAAEFKEFRDSRLRDAVWRLRAQYPLTRAS